MWKLSWVSPGNLRYGPRCTLRAPSQREREALTEWSKTLNAYRYTADKVMNDQANQGCTCSTQGSILQFRKDPTSHKSTPLGKERMNLTLAYISKNIPKEILGTLWKGKRHAESVLCPPDRSSDFGQYLQTRKNSSVARHEICCHFF